VAPGLEPGALLLSNAARGNTVIERCFHATTSTGRFVTADLLRQSLPQTPLASDREDLSRLFELPLHESVAA